MIMESCSRVLILGVILKCCVGYSLYPGIFDPNPFIPKMSPKVLKVTFGQQYQQAPVVHSFSGGDTGDGEVGYVRSDSESGSGGFRHSEHFHKKDGNEYEHEKQVGYGESKDEEEDHGHGKSDNFKKYDSDDDNENDRIYEVNEDNSDDHVNPHQHTTYGVAPTKQKKKKIQLIPEFGTRLTLPKKTSHKKNHNGYETVIYHENEKKGTEKGYDWRNRHNAPPKSVVIANKDEQPREPEYDERQEDEQEEGIEEEHVREEDEDRDHHPDDNEDDDGDQRESERSDYGDNYNSYRYRDDEDEEERENDREADRRSGGGENRRHERRGSGRNNYDYDEEVDREEIDEAANEDKYYGADYDNDDYRRNQYEYASEADYDAQR